MTMIIGISLCDRVYIASDTRLSFYRQGDLEPFQIKDNVLKLITLKGNILVASAGTARFAKYYIKKLMKEKFYTDISTLKSHIIEWTKIFVDDYLKNNDFPTNCILFGGVDKNKHKTIFGKNLIELSKEYQEMISTSMILKPALWEAIKSPENQNNPYPILPTYESCIFALVIDPRGSILKLENAEWGEYLAYGSKGLSKDDIPRKLFGDLELSPNAGDPFHDNTILTMFIKQIAEEKQLNSVGGSIVTHYVGQEDAVMFATGTIHRLNLTSGKEDIISSTEVYGKTIYSKTPRGQLIKLVPIYEYKLPEDTGFSLRF